MAATTWQAARVSRGEVGDAVRRVQIADLAGDRLTWPQGPTRTVTVLDLEDYAALDHHVVASAREALLGRPADLVVGTSRAPLSSGTASLLDALALTCAPGGPGTTWVDRPVEEVLAGISHAPVAAAVLVAHLRATADCPVGSALAAESAAYSVLQSAPEFRRWLARRPASVGDATPVRVERSGDVLHLTLDGAARHNAFGAGTRDELLEALHLAAVDPTITTVELRGAGSTFCSGGDLAEFGTAPDPATAHLLRVQHSPALAVHRLRDRVRPVLHGACIGAGIEIPSFADRVVARDGTWFRLPELAMGLIPGAGGTVGITRRIGRWRCAWMALTGLPVDLDTALTWGLVDDRA